MRSRRGQRWAGTSPSLRWGTGGMEGRGAVRTRRDRGRGGKAGDTPGGGLGKGEGGSVDKRG